MESSTKLTAFVKGENLMGQVGFKIASPPAVYGEPCFNGRKCFVLFCRDCYIKKALFAKNLLCEGCKVMNPATGRVDKSVKEYLKQKEFTGQYEFMRGESYTYETYIDHINNKKCKDSENFEKVDSQLERIQEIKKADAWFDIESESFELKPDWDPDNAICKYCYYFASLDGYIGYKCSSITCKADTDKYSYFKNSSTDSEFHPYGTKIGCQCQTYSLVKIDRIPSTFDQIVRQNKMECQVDFEKCKVKNLPYVQMLQHQKVCLKEIDESLDPLKLDYVVYVHPSGDKIDLIEPSCLTQFKNTELEVKTIEQEVKIGQGFKVCLLRDKNQIFIVGGEGSETKTYIFNQETNMIDATPFDLEYPRIGHSLCSTDNTLFCTGSSVIDKEDHYTCRRVEIYKPEWGCWKVGLNMNDDRYDHYSICFQDFIYGMYGKSPKFKGDQEGMEYVRLDQIYGTQACWRNEDKLSTTKMIKQIGFLPDPYSNKFIILGQLERDRYSYYSDDDDTVPMQYIYDSIEIKKTGFLKANFNAKKHQFDTNNTPFFYMGTYFVFGKNGKEVYKCDRDFEFVN